MRLKTLLSALVLVVLPAAGFAMGCSYDTQVTMSCAEGTTFDDDTHSCVPVVSS